MQRIIVHLELSIILQGTQLFEIQIFNVTMQTKVTHSLHRAVRPAASSHSVNGRRAELILELPYTVYQNGIDNIGKQPPKQTEWNVVIIV